MIKAVVVRILFAAHGSIAFSRVMLSAANTLDDVSMPWWMPYRLVFLIFIFFLETIMLLIFKFLNIFLIFVNFDGLKDLKN